MKFKLMMGTVFIPLLALAVVTQLYLFMPVSTNLVIFVKYATPNNIGLLTTIFGIFYASGLIIWGSLSDKIGKDLTLIIGLLLLACISFIVPLLKNYYLLLFARAIQGFCAASFPPVALAWVSINLSESSKPIAISMISCTFLLAATVGQWLGSFLISNSLYCSMWFLGSVYIFGATIFYIYRSNIKQDNQVLTDISLLTIFYKLPNLLTNRKLFPIYVCSLFVLLSFVTLYFLLHRSPLMIYVPILRNISVFALLFSLTASYLFKVIEPVFVLAISLCLMAVSLLIHMFFLNGQLNNVFILYLFHFIFIIALAYAVPSMIICVALQAELKDRGIATSLYTCILFIGASLGSYLPTLINPLILIIALAILLLICSLQLIFNLQLNR